MNTPKGQLVVVGEVDLGAPLVLRGDTVLVGGFVEGTALRTLENDALNLAALSADRESGAAAAAVVGDSAAVLLGDERRGPAAGEQDGSRAWGWLWNHSKLEVLRRHLGR
jgi:hypothetical protein